MLLGITVALSLALLFTLLEVWRLRRVLRELEQVVATADDRVRALELKLLHARRIP